MNLGQTSVETLNAVRVKLIQVIVAIQRHEPGHFSQISGQLTLVGQTMQKRNGAAHASPAKNLQTRLQRLRLIAPLDCTLEPLTKLTERALRLRPGLRVHRCLIAIQPTGLPTIMCQHLLETANILLQTARYKFAGFETKLERQGWQIRRQPFNKSLDFRLEQKLFMLHAGCLAGSIEWPYPKQKGRARPCCLFIQVNNWNRL